MYGDSFLSGIPAFLTGSLIHAISSIFGVPWEQEDGEEVHCGRGVALACCEKYRYLTGLKCEPRAAQVNFKLQGQSWTSKKNTFPSASPTPAVSKLDARCLGLLTLPAASRLSAISSKEGFRGSPASLQIPPSSLPLQVQPRNRSPKNPITPNPQPSTPPPLEPP